MDYSSNYRKTHQELMREWKSQDSGYKYFTEDGIVNPEVWFSLPQSKRIVFLLKEAYIKKGAEKDWSEAKWINGEHCRDNCPDKANCSKPCPISGKSFNRIAEWTYFIAERPDISDSIEETIKDIYDHVYWLGIHSKKRTKKANKEKYYEKRKELLQRIAIVNLKKADGESRSKSITVTKETSKLLRRQLELIQPHLVVCCGTGDLLTKEQQCELLDGFKVIKVPHPNAHISRIQMLDFLISYFRAE